MNDVALVASRCLANSLRKFPARKWTLRCILNAISFHDRATLNCTFSLFCACTLQDVRTAAFVSVGGKDTNCLRYGMVREGKVKWKL